MRQGQVLVPWLTGTVQSAELALQRPDRTTRSNDQTEMTRSRRGRIFSPVALAVLLAAVLVFAAGARPVVAQALLVVDRVSPDGFPEVVVTFTATDPAGLPIVDIGKDRVQVIHNGQPVSTLALDLVDADQEGLAIGVAIDTSGSMEGAPLEHAKAAVRQLLDRMGPRDRMALVAFGVSGNPVQVVHDLTGDRAALNQAIDSLVARGWSHPRRPIHLPRLRLLWIIMRHAFI